MGNLSGVLAAASLAWRPSSILPSLVIRDISRLDWSKLRRAGYTSVVLDKDQCVTLPLRDHLIPELQESWHSMMATFGPRNILLVSNSAGTVNDPSLIQAEAVSRSLGVNVLVHRDKKPSRRCARAAASYLSSSSSTSLVVVPPSALPLPPASDQPKILVIGDRLTTDIILANRMGATSILTTRIWAPERFGTRVLRSFEWLVYRLVARLKRHRSGIELDACILPEQEVPRAKREGLFELNSLASGFRRPLLLDRLRRFKYLDA